MFSLKRIIYICVVFFVLFLTASFIRQKYVPPIIMYHSVIPGANPQNRLAVSPESFERQMRFLKNFHYNVLSLDELAGLIKDKKKIPPNSIAITFDDGYIDNYIYAFPILKKYDIPATIFVITNEIGRARNDRLDWAQMKVMQDSGLIHFGSHCLGPVPLQEINSTQELKRQIFQSKETLETKLGKPVNAFSYPGGGFDARIRQLVIDAGYRTAVTTSPGRKFSDFDVFALKRLRISSSSDNLFIFWIETSGFYTFLKEHRDKD